MQIIKDKYDYTDDFKDESTIITDHSDKDNPMNHIAIMLYDSDSEEYTKQFLKKEEATALENKKLSSFGKTYILNKPDNDIGIRNYILSNHKEYIYKSKPHFTELADYDRTIYVKNIGNGDIKITKLEIEKDIKFIFEGKERIERAVLRLEDTNEKDMLYSAQYEFAGRKFAKIYVKDEYEIKEKAVRIFANFYKIEQEKKYLTEPSLEAIVKKLERGELDSIKGKVFADFYRTCNSFNIYMDDKTFNESKISILYRMFLEALKFDKKETINYELNPDEITFKLFTSKTR